MRGPRRPLVALLVADAISLTGNAMGFVAIPWFVLETTGSATLTGVGGAIVDRLGFRRTSVLADGVFNPTLQQLDPEPELAPA